VTNWDDDLRNTFSEGLGSRCDGGVGCIEDNLDLWLRSGVVQTNGTECGYLHWATIYVETIELLGSLGGSIRLGEDDRGDATAGTVLVVGEHDPFDGTCGLGEVFLGRGDD
jgi:hypothetical protein